MMRTLTFATLTLAAAAGALAQEPVVAPEFAESYFSGVGRGDVHGPGWDKVMALKGDPIAPRFPVLGRDYDRIVLQDGLIVYLAEDRALPLVQLDLVLRAGSDYETEEERGLYGTMFQRLRSGGTLDREAREIEERLALLNARVSAQGGERSSSISADALSKDLEECLSTLAEFAMHPAFEEPERAAGRRGGAGGGRGGGRGGRNAIGREFRRLVFGEDHPAAQGGGRGGRFGGFGGRGDRGDRFDRDALIDAYERVFRPDNAFLAIVGDFDRADVERLLRPFEGWAASDAPLPEPLPREVPEPTTTPGLYVLDEETSQSQVVIGHVGSHRDDPDRFAIALMNDILGGGSFTSRITESVRSNEGLAYSATSSYDVDGRDVGVFQCAVQTKTASTARAVRLILDEIEKMRTPGSLSKNEFDTAREAVLYSRALSYTDRGRNVMRVLRREAEGRPLDQDAREFEGFMSVTPADIEAAATRALRSNELVICVLGDLDAIRADLEQIAPVVVLEPQDERPRRAPERREF